MMVNSTEMTNAKIVIDTSANADLTQKSFIKKQNSRNKVLNNNVIPNFRANIFSS